MKNSFVNCSKIRLEIEKRKGVDGLKNEMGIIIAELMDLNVTRGQNGERLSEMDYQSLVRLLAIKKAVAS